MGLNGLVVLKAAAKEASEITIKSGYWKSQNHPMSAAAFKKPEPTIGVNIVERERERERASESWERSSKFIAPACSTFSLSAFPCLAARPCARNHRNHERYRRLPVQPVHTRYACRRRYHFSNVFLVPVCDGHDAFDAPPTCSW